MAKFEINLVNWLARKDIRRVFQADKNSPYVAISLVGAASDDENGMLAYVIPPKAGDKDEKAVVKFGTLPLPDAAQPLVKVDLLDYGFAKAGSDVLRGVGRYFEHKDTRYYGVSVLRESEKQKDGQPVLDDDGNEIVHESLVLSSCWERKNGNKEFIGEGVAIPHHDAHGQPIIGQIQDQVIAVIERMNANKPMIDQRRPFWDTVNDTTLYGKFKAQGESDRAARKPVKK